IVAMANLVAVKDMKEHHQEQACYSVFPYGKAMMLENIKRVKPIPIKGLTNGFHLGVFEVNISKEQLTII
ncbi:hypothetical protein LAJ55_14165, partial [Streptococcus pneumoniae]|uniref:hypothetical protein n=1 Tax=Streptococcus pneumoniae TaxID=1313 RepID=UPI001CBAA51B